MIQRKDGEISLPGLKKHTGELFPFIWKASSRTELYQDYQRQLKFCGYVFANPDRYIV